MVHPVLKVPNDKLRVMSQDLSVEELKSPAIQKLIDDMKSTMKLENGVGLAAPQIGKHIRLIIALTEKGPEAFANPKITDRSTKIVDSEEGCLSIPGVWGLVKRHRSVKVKALNQQGEEVRLDTRGLLAIIFQHEIDHLDGVLFVDRAHKIYEPSKIPSGTIV